MTRLNKASIFSLIVTTGFTLASPTFAADMPDSRWTLKETPSTRTLIRPNAAQPLSRIAPATTDDIIRIGERETPMVEIATTSGSVFEAYRSQGDLSRADIAAIKAEIETRFGRPAASPQVETGIIFDPDISMLFKPFRPADYDDPLAQVRR